MVKYLWTHKSHLIRKDTAAASFTPFLLEHPVDSDDLVGHKSDFHPRQEGRQIWKPQCLQRRFHLGVTIKVVRITGDLKVPLNAG